MKKSLLFIAFISLSLGFSACSIMQPKAKKPIEYTSPCACYDIEIKTQVKG